MAPITLLCIDDRPQLLEMRKTLLESHGYRVKMALSGRTALKMLQDASVAAILLEYKSEGLDAEAVACHLKQRFPQIPIVLVSAYACTPERILWLVDEYLMRSELSEGLIPAIERVTQRSHNRRNKQPASRANAA
jgi:two-component system response regulator QseB